VNVLFTLAGRTGPSVAQPDAEALTEKELADETTRLEGERVQSRSSPQAMDRFVRGLMAEDGVCKEMISKTAPEYLNDVSPKK
jgi:hypothetical protein